MPDIAEVLARPDVIKAVHDLVLQAAYEAGVANAHASRIAIGVRSRLEAGEKIDQLVAIGTAFRDGATSALEVLLADPPREFDNDSDELGWLQNRVHLAISKLS